MATAALPDDSLGLELDLDKPPVKAPAASGIVQPPIPLPTPKAPSADDLITGIRSCATPEALEATVALINDATTLTGKVFRALPRATYLQIVSVCRAVKCWIAFRLIFASMVEGIRQRALAPSVVPALTRTPDVTLPALQADTARAVAEVTPITRAIQASAEETRAPARRAPSPIAQATEARRLVRSGDFLIGVGEGLGVSWSRSRSSVKVPRRMLVNVLSGLSIEAPAAKSSVAQFGDVMGSLNSNGLTARAATKAESARKGIDWPSDVARRWIVGTLDTTADLGSLGDKCLVADLLSDETLRFTGNQSLAARVKAAFEARMATEEYDGTDLMAWVGHVLVSRFNAVVWGAGYYVPPAHVVRAREFVTTIKPLTGRAYMLGKVTTEAGLIEGLAEGLAGEVSEIEAEYTKETDRARRENRTQIGPRMACTLIRKLDDARARVQGYSAMLGDAALTEVRATIARVDAKIRPLMDDTSERFAALEMN